jgi:hypothetical protein
MIEQIYNYFSFEMMYLWLNFCVLPFWFVLLFFPQSKICKIFVTSIFPILIFTIVDIYLIFEVYKTGFNLFDNFKLYLGLNELIYLFNETNYIVLFWIHFLAINLFCGCWIVRDYMKINMPKFLAFFPLVLTYFIGPVGLFVYWLFRIIFSKKFSLYD